LVLLPIQSCAAIRLENEGRRGRRNRSKGTSLQWPVNL
jgi:hypothetical protein